MKLEHDEIEALAFLKQLQKACKHYGVELHGEITLLRGDARLFFEGSDDLSEAIATLRGEQS